MSIIFNITYIYISYIYIYHIFVFILITNNIIKNRKSVSYKIINNIMGCATNCIQNTC